MRVFLTVLVLCAALMIGCGGDDGEPIQNGPPATTPPLPQGFEVTNHCEFTQTVEINGDYVGDLPEGQTATYRTEPGMQNISFCDPQLDCTEDDYFVPPNEFVQLSVRCG